MTPHPKPRRPLLAAGRWAGRSLARLGATVITMRLGAAVAGTLLTATVAAALFTVGAVRWWARVIEGRLFAPKPRPTSSVQLVDRPAPPGDEQRDLVFAQALAVVARYLADCLHQADQAGGRR
jgi:hypothetical protein